MIGQLLMANAHIHSFMHARNNDVFGPILSWIESGLLTQIGSIFFNNHFQPHPHLTLRNQSITSLFISIVTETKDTFSFVFIIKIRHINSDYIL